MKMSAADKYLEQKIDNLRALVDAYGDKIDYVADFVGKEVPEMIYGKSFRAAKKGKSLEGGKPFNGEVKEEAKPLLASEDNEED